MQANNIRKGMAVTDHGKVFVVKEAVHRTPGNKRAFMQLTLKNAATGQIIQSRYSAAEDVEVAYLEPKKVQYLYHDQEGYHFMDLTDYHNYSVTEEFIGDDRYYLKENLELEMMCNEEKPIQLNMPKQVTLKVTESPPWVRGDSVSNNTKPAVCETGLKINIPIFIEADTLIRVETKTGRYLGRE